MPGNTLRPLPFALAAALAFTACAGSAPPKTAVAPSRSPAPVERPVASTPHPLGGFAARHVIVLPVQYLGRADAAGWGASLEPSQYLREVDAEITFAFQGRGVSHLWVFPKALREAAHRNASFAADPDHLAAEWLRPPATRLPDQFPDPLASQLRTLLAIEDGAQYELLPVEVRFVPVPGAGGPQRAALRFLLIEPRLGRVLFRGDVYSDPSATFSPALAASLAEHMADLFASR